MHSVIFSPFKASNFIQRRSRSTFKTRLRYIRYFLSLGGDPNYTNQFRDTLLHVSARLEDNSRIVLELVRAGADVNRFNFLRQTPLHIAVIYRHWIVADALIRFGALVNMQDCMGNSALHYAINACSTKYRDCHCDIPDCLHCDPDMHIIERLLRQPDIDVNARNLRGDTPLVWAAGDKNLDIVKTLLEKSALVNTANDRRETALHCALRSPMPSISIAFELLRRGACVACFDNNGHTPLDLVINQVDQNDAQTRAFASNFVRLVTFYEPNDEFISYSLRRNDNLYCFRMDCCTEIHNMRSKNIEGKYSLFDIVVYGMNGRILPLEFETSIEIQKLALSGEYDYYCDFILQSIGVCTA